MSDGELIHVLYHGSGCADGFGAAWAAWRALGDRGVYLPVRYGQPPPDLPEGATVAIVDFSYPREILLALRARCRALDVLDHHKSAREDLAGLDFAHFDMEKSGARLAWEWWHPHLPVPRLIELIEDRDLWRWALPDSRALNAWLRSWPMEFGRWSILDGILDWEPDRATWEGEAILRIEAQQIDAICAAARTERIGNAEVPVVNASSLASEVGERLGALYPEAPFTASYRQRGDGRWQWELRTRHPEVDVSAVAKRFGGGGHRGSAGFVIDGPAPDPHG